MTSRAFRCIIMAALLGCFATGSRAEESNRKPLKPIHIPLKVHYDGTEMHWYGPIQVGTPPQTFNVIFDVFSGGAELEIPSKQCKNCARRQNKFNYNRSSTFSGPFGTGNVIFSILGVNPSATWNYMFQGGIDKVTVGGASVKDQSVGLIIDENEPFREVPFDGFMGLQPLFGGFFTNLIDQGLPAILGYRLAPRSVGGSQLTIGGVDHSLYREEFHTFQGTFLDAFTLRSNFIAINGRTSPYLSSGVLIVPSTVTPTWILDPETTESIYSLISPEIKPFAAQPGTYGIPCKKLRHLKTEIDLSFTSTAGQAVNLTIPSSELSIGPFKSDPSTCQNFIVAYEFEEALGYIGGSLLKHYYVKFNYTDMVNLERTIGFARPA